MSSEPFSVHRVRRVVLPLTSWLLSVSWQGMARLMAAEFAPPTADPRVERLLRKGDRAYASGDRAAAHRAWRRAAKRSPYDERVWLALFSILERHDDRAVCLQNILAINPFNVEARRLLRDLHR